MRKQQVTMSAAKAAKFEAWRRSFWEQSKLLNEESAQLQCLLKPLQLAGPCATSQPTQFPPPPPLGSYTAPYSQQSYPNTWGFPLQGNYPTPYNQQSYPNSWGFPLQENCTTSFSQQNWSISWGLPLQGNHTTLPSPELKPRKMSSVPVLLGALSSIPVLLGESSSVPAPWGWCSAFLLPGKGCPVSRYSERKITQGPRAAVGGGVVIGAPGEAPLEGGAVTPSPADGTAARLLNSCVDPLLSAIESHSSVEGSSKDLEDYREDSNWEQEKEESSEKVEMSHFEPALLPVSCGSVSGDLYKSRFAAGSRSKSIRTHERWFTPEEFVKQELTLTDGHWEKDILCHGKTLNYLVKNKVLDVHPCLCDCLLCCPDEPLHQDKDDVCFICNAEGLLVCCTECPRAFHHCCHLPDLQDKTLGGDWMCTFCVLKTKERLWTPMSREDALTSPVLGNIMRCEYLLLRLYMEDAWRAVTDDTTTTEERYTSVICRPIWLDKVKRKLQDNEYITVRELVHDIMLIFNICQTFNRDNKSGKMGTIMEKVFEKEFDTVFKIQ
ncbi:nuclear body protein SP140 [Ictalurus punctatus]|uniref:Nuclear body protein SP140 n=1 Tax=Ictalurus punctatus TaxID=7998 RepID=A0A979F495_ICTPU|nr:nuclear body protein SP140 [Ictalurus punctatus]